MEQRNVPPAVPPAEHPVFQRVFYLNCDTLRWYAGVEVHPILQQVGDEQHLADLFSEGCTEGLGHAVKIDVERIEQRPVERMRRRDGLSGFCRAVALVDERLIHALVEQRHAVYLHVEFHNAESISIARASAVFAPFASLATPNTNAPSIHAVVSASRSG